MLLAVGVCVHTQYAKHPAFLPSLKSREEFAAGTFSHAWFRSLGSTIILII